MTDCLEQTITVKDKKNDSIRFNLQALKGEQKKESKPESQSRSEKIFTEQEPTKSQQQPTKSQQEHTKPQYEYQTCFKNTSTGPFFCGPIPQMPDKDFTGSDVIGGLAAGATGSMIAAAVGTVVGTTGTVGSVTGIVGALGAGILGTFALPAVIGAALLGGAAIAANKLLND